MKKILFITAVGLFLIGHVNVNGMAPKSPVGIAVVKSGSIIKLFYRGEQSGKVKVTIYNDKGNAVFRETMYQIENFMRPYNFSELPEGEYTLELRDDQGLHYQKVTHSSLIQKRVAHLIRLNEAENKYMLAIPNVGPDALTVKIYDKDNILLYQGTEAIEGNFAKVYNLNGLSQNFRFEILDGQGNAFRFVKSQENN